MVLGVAFGELLLVGGSDVGVRGHEDSLAGAVFAGLEGAGRGFDGAVGVQLGCCFAEIPDRPAAVLGVPVGGALAESAREVAAVVDYGAADAVDHPGPMGDSEY